jgi:putative ABC transport system ATP-binding protein
MTALAKLERVTKVFGSGPSAVEALRGVDLEVERGTMTGIMGPSGSGKTTLLSVLGCLLTPSSGSVEVEGRPVQSLASGALARVRRHAVGFVFQSFNLFPALTARENVQLVLGYKGVRGRKARRGALELLDRLGLRHRAGASPKDLSGGEKQRVAIARALAGDPPLILADEPTSSLDAENGRNIVSLLRDLAQDEERGVVVVTHDPRVEGFCDLVLTLEDGLLRPRRRVVRLESTVDPLENVADELNRAFGHLEASP